MAATHRARILGEFGSLEAYRDHLFRARDVYQVEYAETVAKLTFDLAEHMRRCDASLLWAKQAIGRRDRRK